MKHKIASVIFLLTSISVGLGAFGHGHQWLKHVLPALGNADPGLVRLLELVWYWVSGAMFVFGCLLVWSWSRITRGERALLFRAMDRGSLLFCGRHLRRTRAGQLFPALCRAGAVAVGLGLDSGSLHRGPWGDCACQPRGLEPSGRRVSERVRRTGPGAPRRLYAEGGKMPVAATRGQPAMSPSRP